jgi:hypothetical protein
VAAFVQTKDVNQCKNFYYNNRKKLGFDDGRKRRKREAKEKPTIKSESVEEKAAQPSPPNYPTNLRKTVRRSSEDQSVTSTEPTAANAHISTPPRSRSTTNQALPWTDPEKNYFAQLLAVYGTDWISIGWHIKTKSEYQLIEYYEENKGSLGALIPDRRKRGRRSSISGSGDKPEKVPRAKRPKLNNTERDTPLNGPTSSEPATAAVPATEPKVQESESYTYNPQFLQAPENQIITEETKDVVTNETITMTTTVTTTSIDGHETTNTVTNYTSRTSTVPKPADDGALLAALQKRPSRRKTFGGSYYDGDDEDYKEEKVPVGKSKGKKR